MCLLALATAAQTPSQPNASASPTFVSLGLYYNRPQAADTCRVFYPKSNSDAWREGYPLVYDAREPQYRGSLVQLQPATTYEVRLEAGSDKVTLQARTWSEQFPIGKTTILTGVPLPGFNDDFTGAAPDIGAFENGAPPLRFGRQSAPGFQRAPWER